MSTNAEQTSEGIDNLRQAHDELRSKHTELQGKYRQLRAEVAFKDASLNPKHADLFLRTHPDADDITADAVTKFAKEYDLAPQAPPATDAPPTQPSNQPEGQVQQPNPEASALQQMGSAGGTAAGTNPPSVPGQKLSQVEFQKLYQTDRAAALQAYTEGRVEHADGNLFADQAKRAGVIE